jgi:hypothetical protein
VGAGVGADADAEVEARVGVGAGVVAEEQTRLETSVWGMCWSRCTGKLELVRGGELMRGLGLVLARR